MMLWDKVKSWFVKDRGNYFSVSFYYPGPYSNFASPDLSHLALSEAERDVNTAAKELVLQMEHEYSWPDGSLYKFFRTLLSGEELQKILDTQFIKDQSSVRVYEVKKVSPDTDPGKYGYKTLRALFNS